MRWLKGEEELDTAFSKGSGPEGSGDSSNGGDSGIDGDTFHSGDTSNGGDETYSVTCVNETIEEFSYNVTCLLTIKGELRLGCFEHCYWKGRHVTKSPITKNFKYLKEF